MASTRGPRIRVVPEGDDRSRLTCPDCGFVAYENPKVVAGVVASHQDRILLCRRAIEPRRGFWTLPAGYMELAESPEEGALREAWEEARARLELDGLLAVYAVRHISQVQLFYRAKLVTPKVEPGPESLEVELFPWDGIPWQELAFPTVAWALQAWEAVRGESVWRPFGNPRGRDPARLTT
ncbi:MAG: NUDIX hydrolase [Myxococcota bacterium]